MKRHILEFLRRGVVACGFGPIVLAILYLVLHHHGVVDVLTVHEVCLGIISLFLLAFIAGGMNFIYQIEQLPLMLAILIHGSILYISYLATYLLNDWLDWGWIPILVFSAIFLLGYLGIWAVIYVVTKKKTAQVNELLKKRNRIDA